MKMILCKPIKIQYINKSSLGKKKMEIEMYTQMGFSEAQVRKAYEYSKKKKIDMFDALQQIQNRDYADQDNKVQSNVPPYSFLNNLKNININQYEILYSRFGNKQNSYARDEIRQVNTPVGLFNVANCCYLNSLLQCYFLMGAFTREILQAQQMLDLPQSSGIKNKRIQNQYMLLDVLKQIFSKMKMSSRRYLDPTPVLKNLVNSVGEKIEYGDEKDLNEINMQVVERLSQCLMFTKKYYTKSDGSPSKLKKRENIKNLFYGQKMEEIEGVEGQNLSDFMGFILNPKHGNILFALDQELNYDVQIDGKLMKKHTFLRSLPFYLFLTISRIEYEKKKNQAIKNSEKIAFDFVIYLDQYLQSNRQETKIKGPKIRQLQNRKAVLKSQENHLNMLAEKLQQCRQHAKFLRGWQERLPQQEEIDKQKNAFKREIEEIEKQLAEIQTRKQKFVLMYIFVHRGNAISGHYWGYGKNGNNWYRFDVNCTLIKEADILIDMEKSVGIPYCLVYAKQDQIQSFAYPYYTNPSIMSSQLLNNSNEKQDYVNLIPQRLKRQIIEENIAMHQSIEKQKNKLLVTNIVKEYKTKFNIVKSEIERYSKVRNDSRIPLYSNFSCYLQSIGQNQFMKYNVFSNAVFSKTQMTSQQLIEDEAFLKTIQKSFRKKIKGKMSLKHFAIQCQPVEGTHYKKAIEEYLTGKKCLEFIKQIYNNLKDWPKIPNLADLFDQISEVVRQGPDGVYLKNITSQLIAIMLIDLTGKGIQIRFSWVSACDSKNPLLENQLRELGAKQISGNKKRSQLLSKIQLEQDWSILSLKKGFESECIRAVKQIIDKLSESMQIYKINTKQKRVVKKEVKKEQVDLI